MIELINRFIGCSTCLNFPEGKLYCLSCGEYEYRQFLSASADEAVYQGIGNPFAG